METGLTTSPVYESSGRRAPAAEEEEERQEEDDEEASTNQLIEIVSQEQLTVSRNVRITSTIYE